jgi:hypothetical protein
MPYYRDIDILFIHIPKTGGTSIENFLNKTYKETLLCGWKGNYILPEIELRKCSLQHQTYNTIYKYRDILEVDFNINLKVITIVRNPYDRIISDLIFLELINTYDTCETVYNVIKEYIHKDCYDNHNIPQFKFVTDENEKLIKNIHIFRTESLTQDMHNFGFTDYIGSRSNIIHSNYLNKDSIQLINLFYKKDFELFNYTYK